MDRYFVKVEEQGRHNLFPGVDIATAAGEKLMISRVHLEPGAEVPRHAHPHEQCGVLLSGELTFIIGGQREVLRPGDCWCIPGGVEHECRAGDEPVEAIDLFTPIRDDYL